MLLAGLKRVEYRGYDSAGIAVLGPDALHVIKRQGKMSNLEAALGSLATPAGTTGIGHTRWATHGDPSDRNAHPHLSCDGRIAVVHNGTIENYQELRTLLQSEGHAFTSDTDTEVLAHLLEKFVRDGSPLARAVQTMHTIVQGAYGIAVIRIDEPTCLVAARHGSPLVIGKADHGYFAASDATAFREYTDHVLYLDDGEMAVFENGGHRIVTLQNQPLEKKFERLEWSLEQIAKGGYPHFMLKEIMEQPSALSATLAGRLTEDGVHLGGLGSLLPFVTNTMERVLITACGTSWHAGLIGRRMLEKLLGIPVMVEYASEFATGHTPVDDRTLCVTITQSGETKDTIEAAKRAKRFGATLWNICNVVGSSMARLADAGMYLHVGPEIGVASTKAFTAQVVAQSLFALKLASLRGQLSREGAQRIMDALHALPEQVRTVLAAEPQVRTIARAFALHPHALYLGRGYNFPTALEGALKLKEISYIHAEGYPAGEMKHGPIALIDENMPVVVIAPQESEDEQTFQKILANVEEVASRGGRVILIASEHDPAAATFLEQGRIERVLTIPPTLAMFTPVLASVHLQLLAYHMAVLRGCDVDQPRNLAKSVTVE